MFSLLNWKLPILITLLIFVLLGYLNQNHNNAIQPLATKDLDSKSQCKSRFEHALYAPKQARFHPSDLLLQRFKRYEALHSSCSQNFTLNHTSNVCKYVVFIPNSGLGNKIIALVSAFLYALLTDRVLLVSRHENMDKLFCEPFPSGSWLLPELLTDQITSAKRLGDAIASQDCNSINTSLHLPYNVVFAELSDFYSPSDKMFFCETVQRSLKEVPWLAIASNQYFSPALYNIPEFKELLVELFPAVESTFHLLVRYILHPSNVVWERTTRYFDTYLAHADLRVGVQMREHIWFHNARAGNEASLPDDFLQCLVDQKVLPEVSMRQNEPARFESSRKKRIAVLVTSLSLELSDVLREFYLKGDTVDGSTVSVFQPSHEDQQKTGDTRHDVAALMEIYLLSLCDKLLTSPCSTFGYSAHGLAGFHPLQMLCKKKGYKEDPVCALRPSMEPCYHAYPMEMKVNNTEACE